MPSPKRKTSTTTRTRVSLITTPHGRSRENGPHLFDLRAFVKACDGLPGEVPVRIITGHLTESGRRDVEFLVHFVHAEGGIDEPMAEGGGSDAS